MQKNALMRTWRVRRGKSLCPCDRSCRLSTAVLANCDLSEFSWTSCTCGFPASSNIRFQTSRTLFDPRCFRRKSTKTHTELLKPRVSGSSNNMGQYGVFDILAFYFFPANSFGRVAQKMPEMTTFAPPSTPFQSLRTTNQHHNGLGLGRKTQEQLASLRKVKTLRKRGLDKFSSPSLVLVKLLRFANLKVSGNAWEYCQLPSLVLKLGFFEWFLSLNNLGKAKMRPLQIAHVYACLVAGDNPEPGHTENRFLYYVNPFPMGSMYASMHLDSWFLW